MLIDSVIDTVFLLLRSDIKLSLAYRYFNIYLLLPEHINFYDRSPFPDYHRPITFQHMLVSSAVHLYALLSVETYYILNGLVRLRIFYTCFSIPVEPLNSLSKSPFADSKKKQE